MLRLAKGDDPAASLPNPEAENAADDVCGTDFEEEVVESAASSVAGCVSAIEEEFFACWLDRADIW